MKDTLTTATVAVVMLTTGAVGATLYDNSTAPVTPQNEIRYEKVDDDTYKKYTVVVQEETYKASDAANFIHLLNVSMKETEGSLDPDDQKKFIFASTTKAEKLAELEQVKALGVIVPDHEQ